VRLSLQPIAATIAATVVGEYAGIITMQRIVNISQQVVLQQPLSAPVAVTVADVVAASIAATIAPYLMMIMMMMMMMMNEFPFIAA